jgi:hypothetical protein
METDLDLIRRLGEERGSENMDFRAYLKGHDMDCEELDSIVHQIAGEVTEQVDCSQCMNCCVELRPEPTEEEQQTIAGRLVISREQLELDYLQPNGDEDSGQPHCSFLKENRCCLEEDRPEDCRDYPFLMMEGFRWRLLGVVGNYRVCPIVFNTYELLKERLWRRRPRRRRRRRRRR